MNEQPLLFDCGGERLLGVLATPAAPGHVGVVIVVGGPQYRAGSHRQFVLTARRLAAAGHPVLRFDFRGMGDSTGSLRSFEDHSGDISAAVDALLAAQPQVRQVVLWGLCDGASAALLYLSEPKPDTRVAGLCLINPWVRSPETLARTHVKHYYLQRLRQQDFWLKLVRGNVAWKALRGLLDNVNLATSRHPARKADSDEDFIGRMARSWRTFEGPIMLILSGDDITANEFREALRDQPKWRQHPRAPKLAQLTLAGADHTLSDVAARQSCDDAVVNWLSGLAGTICPGRRLAATLE